LRSGKPTTYYKFGLNKIYNLNKKWEWDYIVRAIHKEMGGPIITIHDCYGPHLLDIKNFKKAAKKIIQHIYDKNILSLNKNNDNFLIVKGRFIFL